MPAEIVAAVTSSPRRRGLGSRQVSAAIKARFLHVVRGRGPAADRRGGRPQRAITLSGLRTVTGRSTEPKALLRRCDAVLDTYTVALLKRTRCHCRGGLQSSALRRSSRKPDGRGSPVTIDRCTALLKSPLNRL